MAVIARAVIVAREAAEIVATEVVTIAEATVVAVECAGDVPGRDARYAASAPTNR